MIDNWFKAACLVIYAAALVAIAVYGMHRYVLVYLYLKHRARTFRPAAEPGPLPRVTVQLPMFNEQHVAERVIAATCAIDYPRDLLEIQVLDDSTDESADIARAAVERFAAAGLPIRYLHRANRSGYKAGALAEGLTSSTGELVAIFDADFIPPPDVLRNAVHYFADPRVGMVQMRWDHLNRDASLLTRGQAIFLDAHFVIEHTARNRSGRFMHFNGTAGVWRRQTIDDAGGWHHDTLTEDLDLSYRAQLRGWQFVYLPQHAAPAELPPEIIAFKQQAHRWTKGSVQTAMKLLPRILRSPQLPWSIKSEAFFHLTCTLVYPLMVLVTLMMYPVFIYVGGPLKHYSMSSLLFGMTLFILATCSASTFFVFAQRELFGKGAGWRALAYLPFLMALGVGISLNNAKAVFEAVVSSLRRRPSEFVRTPKYGVTGRARSGWLPQGVMSFRRLALPIVEIAFGVYMTCFLFVSLMYGFALLSAPFLLIFAGGYLYVGVNSLRTLWRMHQEATQPAPVKPALQG